MTNAETIVVEAETAQGLQQKINTAIAGRNVFTVQPSQSIVCGKVVYAAVILMEKQDKRQHLVEG